ncbi:MAG: alpha-hydroxy acid oxidase [Dehalococcoidia bacterium]
MDVVRLEDFEVLARAQMDGPAFDYYAGGAADELTLGENIAAFQRRRLRPRVLVDVSSVAINTQILGKLASFPVGLAPAALQRLAHDQGEVAAARAAADAGIIYALSTLSSCSVEEVGAAGGRLWFQLYVHKDRSVSRDLVQRAEAAGYEAIVLTVDLPVTGYRERELRGTFAVDPADYGNLRMPSMGDATLAGVVAFLNDQSLTWNDIAWVRSLSSLPLVIKGIMRGDDARLAVEHGAAGLVVSNHGGRQLDRTQASIDALEEIVASVDGAAEVYLDGGVRRGADVAIAIALGATAVFVGRPYLYALAAGGEEGVRKAIDILRAELLVTMALLGAPAIGALTRDMVI